MESNYIAISGNIGVGKTTLANNLKSMDNRIFINEEDMSNPFLPLFYEDMLKYSFKMQMWFLVNRIASYNHMGSRFFIQDRIHNEEFHIFVKNMHKMGLLSTAEFNLYRQYFKVVDDLLPKPKFTIFLSASVQTLSERIFKRGREYEQDIDIQYIKNLNNLYEEWADKQRYREDFIYIDTNKLSNSSSIWIKEIYNNRIKPVI